MPKTRGTKVIPLLSSIVIPNNIRGEDIQTYVGVMQVKDLLSRYHIPYWEHENRKGYQRSLEERRVKKFAADLKEEKVSVPTALLLSVRDESVKPKLTSGGVVRIPATACWRADFLCCGWSAPTNGAETPGRGRTQRAMELLAHLGSDLLRRR